MQLTTRSSPYHLEELFPFLRGRGRDAIRLHPRRQQQIAPFESKIGGSFVWPRNEAHPVCPEQHCPAVPVIQLRKADAQVLPFPKGTDLFQLLWFPWQYDDCQYNPKIEIYWRNSDALSQDNVLSPVYENHEEMYEVHECRLRPETVTEYPYVYLLDEDERQQIEDWEQTAGDPLAGYQKVLSTCPGTKIGGYPNYDGQDAPRPTGRNGAESTYLLTISDSEWDGGSFARWRPIEQQFPPGTLVSEEQPDGGSVGYTRYTAEEEQELEQWTHDRWVQYHSERAALGTYLKQPMNVFVDACTDPWVYSTA